MDADRVRPQTTSWVPLECLTAGSPGPLECREYPAEHHDLQPPSHPSKVWMFDRPEGGARLLRSRSGHSAPPSLVRFHRDAVLAGGAPAGQSYLLSGGADRTLRQAALWTSQQDAEYSQVMSPLAPRPFEQMDAFEL